MTEMREIRCGVAEHTSKPIQVFFTPIDGHSGLQEFRCPYCNGREQWRGLPGRIARVLINGPQWQEYNVPQENSFGCLELLKDEALCRGFTKIKRDEENAKEVLLKDWSGFSGHVSGMLYATVIYEMQGNKLRIQKTLDSNEYWYTFF
jgi:hypothetical protein